MSLHHSVVDMSADAPKGKWLSGFGQVQQTPFLPSKSWRAGQVKALLVMGGSCTTIHDFHLTPVQANRQEKVSWKRCTTWHCPQAVRAGEAHITPPELWHSSWWDSLPPQPHHAPKEKQHSQHCWCTQSTGASPAFSLVLVWAGLTVKMGEKRQQTF